MKENRNLLDDLQFVAGIERGTGSRSGQSDSGLFVTKKQSCRILGTLQDRRTGARVAAVVEVALDQVGASRCNILESVRRRPCATTNDRPFDRN
jgi:hypothetical protein